jgi:hypothetical protein
MIPIPARVLFPALVSLVSGLWALTEWLDHRAVEDVGVIGVDDDAAREAREAAERRRLELAERKMRLAEAREARLAGRTGQARKEATADGKQG